LWEATHAFNRFSFAFVVLSYFVGNCPRTIQENNETKFFLSLRCQKLGTARACNGTAVPSLAKPTNKKKTSKLARPVPVVARPCPTSDPYIPIFSFLLPSFFNNNLSHLSNLSLKLP